MPSELDLVLTGDGAPHAGRELENKRPPCNVKKRRLVVVSEHEKDISPPVHQ